MNHANRESREPDRSYNRFVGPPTSGRNDPISQHTVYKYPCPTWIMLAYLPSSRAHESLKRELRWSSSGHCCTKYQLPSHPSTCPPRHSRADLGSFQREREARPLIFFPLLFFLFSFFIPFSFSSTLPFCFGKRSFSATSAFCRYCAPGRLLVTFCRCYGTICGFLGVYSGNRNGVVLAVTFE